MSSSKVVLRVLYVCIVVLVALLIILGMGRLCYGAYDMGYRIFTEQPVDEVPGRDVIVVVEKGTSSLALGKTMEEKGLVRSAYLFWIQMNLSAYAGKVQPGTYTLSTSQTAREMLKVMSTKPAEDKETTE